jgi:hypothetical protein
MFQPGDVIGFYVRELDKEKYHLCISLNGYYVFVSSQREITYEGDLIVPCTEFPFLTPTESGLTRISCTRVLPITNRQLKAKTSLRKLGTVSKPLLLKIVEFIEGNPTIPEETQEAILTGLDDWL